MKKKCFLTLAIICLLVLAFLGFEALKHKKTDFPFRRVIVHGVYWHVSQESLEQIITPYAKRGYFFANLFALQRQLKKDLPWIESANVSRQWPDQLIVTLHQKTAVAVLNDNALLTSDAEVFTPSLSSFPPDLPELIGSENHAVELLKYYQLFTSVVNSASLSIMQIKVSADNHWSVETSNKIVVMLGDKDILTRLERFMKIYQQVFVPQHREPSYVDMRYSHGMAVNWKN